jgi:hypothetical protein
LSWCPNALWLAISTRIATRSSAIGRPKWRRSSPAARGTARGTPRPPPAGSPGFSALALRSALANLGRARASSHDRASSGPGIRVSVAGTLASSRRRERTRRRARASYGALLDPWAASQTPPDLWPRAGGVVAAKPVLGVPAQCASLRTPYRPCSDTYKTSASLLRPTPLTVFSRTVSRWRVPSMTGTISRPRTASCSISGGGTSGQAAVTQIRSYARARGTRVPRRRE